MNVLGKNSPEAESKGDRFGLEGSDGSENLLARRRHGERLLVQLPPPLPVPRRRESLTAMLSCTRVTYAVGTR